MFLGVSESLVWLMVISTKDLSTTRMSMVVDKSEGRVARI